MTEKQQYAASRGLGLFQKEENFRDGWMWYYAFLLSFSLEVLERQNTTGAKRRAHGRQPRLARGA